MESAGSGNSSGKDLGTLAYALSESADILVIDVVDLICAELADLLVSLVALTEGLLLRLSLRGSLLLIVIHLTYLLLIMWDGPRHHGGGASAFLRTAGRRR